MARPRGIEPRSQAPEAYVISIGPRAQIANLACKIDYMVSSKEMQVVFISMGKIRSRLALAYYALNRFWIITAVPYALSKFRFI